MSYAIFYLAAINLFALTLTCADKIAAIKHKRRVPERTLFLTAFLGGSAGVLFSMIVFRHKIKHKKFTAGVPFILFLQLVLLGFIWLK